MPILLLTRLVNLASQDQHHARHLKQCLLQNVRTVCCQTCTFFCAISSERLRSCVFTNDGQQVVLGDLVRACIRAVFFGLICPCCPDLQNPPLKIYRLAVSRLTSNVVVGPADLFITNQQGFITADRRDLRTVISCALSGLPRRFSSRSLRCTSNTRRLSPNSTRQRRQPRWSRSSLS
jgi:hypothetical protein